MTQNFKWDFQTPAVVAQFISDDIQDALTEEINLEMLFSIYATAGWHTVTLPPSDDIEYTTIIMEWLTRNIPMGKYFRCHNKYIFENHQHSILFQLTWG